jgi:hypothetical protein
MADVEAFDAKALRIGQVEIECFGQRTRAFALRALFGASAMPAPLTAMSSQMRRCSRGWCSVRTRWPACWASASISAASTAWLSTSSGGTLWPR